MLKIRAEQLQILQEEQARRFEREAVAHVRSSWPEQVAAQGEDGVHAMVARAVERAGAHGFDEEFDILRYLNLVCALGEDFDERLDWAAAILADRDHPARGRMDALTERAIAAESGEPNGGNP